MADENRINEKLRELCLAYNTASKEDDERRLRKEIAELIPPVYVRQLKQLADKGPVEDGDVMSKALRGVLIQCKLAARVLVKGEWGYTACTYLGGHVLTAVEELEVSRRPA